MRGIHLEKEKLTMKEKPVLERAKEMLKESVAEQKNLNRRISVSFGRTLNKGNYESTRIDMSLERDLEQGEDYEKAIADEFKAVRTMVHKAIIGDYKE